MNKKEFDKQLTSKLGNLPHEERQKALDYYNELFLDRQEHGESETDIIKSFGSPEEAAARILSEPSVFTKTTRKLKATANKFFTNKSFLIFYFSAFIITFPLTIAAFSVAFALGVAAFSILFALFVCAVAFMVVGPLYMIMGPISAGGFTAAGWALFGCGLVLLALGIALTLLLPQLNKLRILLFVKRENKPKAFQKARWGKKTVLVVVAVIFSLTLLGGSLFTVGLASADWNVRNLDTAKYTDVGITIEQPVNKITLNVRSRNVRIVGVAENFRVEANNFNQGADVTITLDNGELKITEAKYSFNFHDMFNLFGSTNWRKRNIYVFVPENIAEVNAKLTSGNLEIKNITAATINVNMTSGNVNLNNCTATTITAVVSSGNINSTSLRTSHIDFKANSGNIHARVVGTRADYNITSSVRSGNNNVGTNASSSGNTITISARSGNIRLTFV